MPTEDKPEAFASPEQNHENGSSSKKKRKKKTKKKNNEETLPQTNEHSQSQVSSDPLVVTPISEFKSNQEESNEPKPLSDTTVSIELENKKEVEKSNSERGKLVDVVVVENALNHDKEQVDSIDRRKRQKCEFNEHNVEPAETAGQVSVVDREVSLVDPTIRLNNQHNSENEHNVGPAETVVQISKLDREAFASPEQNHENGSKKKKRKKGQKKKNNETSPQTNENPQPQVSSDLLVVTPISGPAETAGQISVVDREVSLVDPTIQLNNQTNSENEHNVGPVETVVQISKLDREAFASPEQNHENGSKKKRKPKKKNNETSPQTNENPQPQVSSDPLVVTPISEPAETAGQISVVDREVSLVDPTIRLNNQLNSENEHNVGLADTVVQISKLDREAFASPEQNHENGSKKKKRKKGAKKKNNETSPQTNENPQPQVSSDPLVVTPISEPAETAGQISVVDREVSLVDPTIRLNNQLNSENEHNVGLADTVVQISKLDREAFASPEQNHENGSKKKKRKKGAKKKNNETSPQTKENPQPQVSSDPLVVTPISEPAETAGQISVVDREVSLVDPTIRLNNQTNSENEHNVGPVETVVQISKLDREAFASPEQNHENGGKKKRKKKTKKKNNETLPQTNEHPQPQVSSDPLVFTPISEFKSNQEESNEPKPSLDATVSTELENKKEVEKSEVYAEFKKTPSGKIKKRKRKSKSETGKTGEVVVVENVLNHDSEQVNEIDRRKRHKSVQDGAQSNEDNVEPAETAVQISVVDSELSLVDPTIRLNNQPANLVEQKDERKIRQEKHLELMKMQKIAKEERKRLEKEERERLKKIRVMDEINKDKMQVKRKYELRSRGEENTYSGICWACRELNHSIKQCQKLKSLSKDEKICFFCGEIGHSLGKCSVYKAGGGRFARCLFCNLQGHFSNKCPGHGFFQGAVAGGS